MYTVMAIGNKRAIFNAQKYDTMQNIGEGNIRCYPPALGANGGPRRCNR